MTENGGGQGAKGTVGVEGITLSYYFSSCPIHRIGTSTLPCLIEAKDSIDIGIVDTIGNLFFVGRHLHKIAIILVSFLIG